MCLLDAYGNRLLLSYARMDAALPFGQTLSCVDNVHSSTIRQEMCVDMQQMATPCDESALGPDVSVERQWIAGFHPLLCQDNNLESNNGEPNLDGEKGKSLETESLQR